MMESHLLRAAAALTAVLLAAQILPSAAATCTVPFAQQTLQFEGCVTLDFDVTVLWSFPPNTDTIRVAITRPTSSSHYISFAFGTNTSMTTNNAFIAVPRPDGTAFSSHYHLEGGVAQDVFKYRSRRQISDPSAELSNGTLTAHFTRPLAPGGGFPVIVPGQLMHVVWAVGVAPKDGGSILTTYASQSTTKITLRQGNVDAPLASPSDMPDLDRPDDCDVSIGDTVEMYTNCRRLTFDIDVFWRFPQGEQAIEVALQRQTMSEYMAFSFSEGSQMVVNSAIVAYPMVDGSSVASDYLLTTRSDSGVTEGNGGQGLTSLESDFSGGILTVTFTRPLAPAASSSDRQLPTLDPGSTVPVIWAVGPAPQSGSTLVNHGPGNRASGTLDLTGVTTGTTTGSNLSNALIAHAVLMCIAWLFLVPLGIILARYMKAWSSWFQFHRAIQISAVVLGTASWALGLFEGSHTFKTHLSIGSIASIIGILQVVGGAARPQAASEGEEPSPIRKFWYLGHSYLGRLGAVLAFANVFIGIQLSPTRASAGSTTGYLVGVIMYLILLLVVIAVLEVRKRRIEGNGQ